MLTKTKLIGVTLVMLFVLAGCSTTMSDRQVEAMNTPTLTLNCTTGCSASYTDPRDRPSMPTNGWDVGIAGINAAAGVVKSTAPWAAIGYTAVEGISNAVGDDNSDNSNNSDNSVRIDNSDNSDNRTDDNSTDSTHEPTIVRPEVVTSPDPVIVQPQGSGEE